MAYGAKYVGSLWNASVQPMTRRFKVKANEVITKGDWLNIESGKLLVASAGDSVIGVAHETVTGNAGATSTCETVVARPGDLYIMDNDNDTETFAATDVGEYHDLVGTTGIQQIDTNADSSTVGQFLCIEYNPQGFGYDSDTSIGLYTPTQTMFSSQYNE